MNRVEKVSKFANSRQSTSFDVFFLPKNPILPKELASSLASSLGYIKLDWITGNPIQSIPNSILASFFRYYWAWYTISFNQKRIFISTDVN
jgi:hypothetical protein